MAFSLEAVMFQCTWSDQCTKDIPQHLSGAIHSVHLYFMTDSSTPPPSSPSPCMHIYSFKVTPFYVRDFINLILSSPILTLLVCHSFLILFYLINSKIDVFVSNTHHFLASHSVNSSLPQKALPLMMTSNCQVILPSMVADEAQLCK